MNTKVKSIKEQWEALSPEEKRETMKAIKELNDLCILNAGLEAFHRTIWREARNPYKPTVKK